LHLVNLLYFDLIWTKLSTDRYLPSTTKWRARFDCSSGLLIKLLTLHSDWSVGNKSKSHTHTHGDAQPHTERYILELYYFWALVRIRFWFALLLYTYFGRLRTSVLFCSVQCSFVLCCCFDRRSPSTKRKETLSICFRGAACAAWLLHWNWKCDDDDF